MKTIPIAGAGSVSFFEDDTLDVVRQHIALAVNSYPPRMYVEARVSLPEEYYADPRHWEALFLRVSFNGMRVDKGLFKLYVEQVRGLTVQLDPPASREDWMSRPAALEPLYAPGSPFLEWRPFGVPDERCVVLPIPPQDLPDLPAARIPISNGQSLFETLYARHEIAEFRSTMVTPEASQLVLRVYFPLLQSDTPQRLSDSEIQSLQTTTEQLKSLLELNAPQSNHVSILRAKWFVPLVETEFSAPRARFEEMFYGLTVSKKTPYVGYFTSRQELTRHKFFVADEKTKTPTLDLGLWKSWSSNTQPQRRLPTLLLYRGTGRTSFDRIAITNKDITFTAWRTKESTETLEEIQTGFVKWFTSLDAVTPFVETRDLDNSRWELHDLSILASFAKEITQFDMLRFPCLRSIFSSQNDSFRLMRAEHLSSDMTPQELRAYQLLYETEDSNANTLVTEMGMDIVEAEALVQKFVTLGEEVDLERILRGYPTFKYRSKEVIISSVTNVERVLQYASLLRYVLTSEDAVVNSICPRRLQVVEAVSAPATTVTVQEGDFQVDDDLAALLGLDEAPEPVVAAAPAPAPNKKVKVEATEGTTYNYFNRRLRKFNPVMFDEAYPSNCEKTKQVVVLTPEDEERIPEEYSGRAWHALKLKNPRGIAICPQYWCVVDEIPLRADQLVDDACPVCQGKVITKKTDRTPEFSIIKRGQDNVFPEYKKGQPCCYKERRESTVLKKDDDEDGPIEIKDEEEAKTKDDTYVLGSVKLTARRLAYLPDDLARALHIKTNYEKSVPKKRIETGNADFFRIGLGRPRDTLRVFLNDKKTIISAPDKAVDTVMKCSFFRTWTDLGEGNTQTERIISGITDAYAKKTLPPLDELEYVTAILKCRVIRISTKTNTVSCGYWADALSSQSRTIVLLDGDILGYAQRRLTKSKDDEKFEYKIDVQKEPFSKETASVLNTLHTQACVSNTPDLQAAFTELRVKSKSNPILINDPFGRTQAVFVPGVVVLPIQPVTQPTLKGVPVRNGYADVKEEELPTQADLRAFLDTTTHPGFKWVEDLTDVHGRPTESLLASGFRAPFRPGTPIVGTPAKEVVATIRETGENPLINGAPNAEDAKTYRDISYAAEVFDFLLFSLSKDIQNEEYRPLRNSIIKRDDGLYKRLETWLAKRSYWDLTQNPRDFVNKVRTPCGQFKQKDACNTSSLCGWSSNACRIRVNESIEKRSTVLRRMVKTLMENDKQRALVLDERMSPFFSTVLYMEMPHEWITTSV